MPVRLGELMGAEPVAMSTMTERRRLRRAVPPSGVYLLSEDRPLYVGRSDNIAGRVLMHSRRSSDHHSATFAFNLARSHFPADVPRRELLRDPEFQWYFDRAKDGVRHMTVRAVAIPDPIEQTVFEVYAHLALDTPFNSFEVH